MYLVLVPYYQLFHAFIGRLIDFIHYLLRCRFIGDNIILAGEALRHTQNLLFGHFDGFFVGFLAQNVLVNGVSLDVISIAFLQDAFE